MFEFYDDLILNSIEKRRVLEKSRGVVNRNHRQKRFLNLVRKSGVEYSADSINN